MSEKFYLRDEINDVRKTTDRFRKEELDSTEDDLGWDFHDSDLNSFETSFANVLPEDTPNLGSYISSRYHTRQGHLVGLELGGSGQKLFRDIAPGYFKKTAGVVLSTKDDYISSKHEIIAADIFSKRHRSDIDGFQKVQAWAEENGKVDILFERMVAPINNQKFEYSDIFIHFLKRFYKLLNHEGTAFIQIKSNYGFIQEITDFFRKHADKFEFQIDNQVVGLIRGYYIRLRKLPGAPETLDELIKLL